MHQHAADLIAPYKVDNVLATDAKAKIEFQALLKCAHFQTPISRRTMNTSANPSGPPTNKASSRIAAGFTLGSRDARYSHPDTQRDSFRHRSALARTSRPY